MGTHLEARSHGELVWYLPDPVRDSALTCVPGADEMAPQLRAPTPLAEDLSSVPST